MRRTLVLVLAIAVGSLAFTTAASAGGHEWGDVEPHGHVMLIGFEMEATEGGTLVYFKRCVEFANGRKLPTPAHHNSVHTGNAGGSPFVQGALFNAGNAVVPLAPFGPPIWNSCDDFESPFFVPE